MPAAAWFNEKRDPAPQSATLYPDYVPDPIGSFDATGKPIFDSTVSHKYTVSEKEMTDAQKMSWRTYQLYKLTLKLERRDTVYEALMSSDYANFNCEHHWLGTPYPIIEPYPFMLEVFYGVRWYEHAISFLFGHLFYQYQRTRPNIRYTTFNPSVNRIAFLWIWCTSDMLFGFRSCARLQGKCENHHECLKYGILETKERLAQKAENWRKFADYKKEWVQRFDYYIWGMRPGERHTFFSQCHWGPKDIDYNTRLDFPQRLNPFVLSTTPINKWRIEVAWGYFFQPGADTPLERSKPEMHYQYRGGVG